MLYYHFPCGDGITLVICASSIDEAKELIKNKFGIDFFEDLEDYLYAKHDILL